MLTHRVPYPPDRGDRIRSFHLLKFLAARAEVYLASTNTEAVAENASSVLRELCAEVEICHLPRVTRACKAAASLLSGRSATEGYFWSSRLASTVRRWGAAHKFDAVLCYCSGMFQYTAFPELAGARRVVDLVDVDSQKWAHCAKYSAPPGRWLHQLESTRIERLEREIADRADHVVVISNEERDFFNAIAPQSRVTVVSNGVDLEYFNCANDSDAEPRTCCFVGVLNYAPNVDGLKWFCANVWPAVRAAVPDAKFLVVGKSPVSSIRRLSSMPGVEIHENVPDVRPYLRRSSVVVSPLRFARGVQNKVLEAMAMGKAVVATPTSLAGLHSAAAELVVCSQTPLDFAQALVSLFREPVVRNEIGRVSREFVAKSHDWRKCLSPLESLIGLSTDDGRRSTNHMLEIRASNEVAATTA